MKKVLFILFALISITTQAQVANGTETKQNAFRSMSPQTATTVNYLTTMGTDGTMGRVTPVNVTIPTVPLNYTVLTPTLGAHLSGIDTRLGQISSTTAGLTQRIYFTADDTTVNSVVYFASNSTGKGATAAGSPPALVLADNTKGYFTKDLISIPQPAATIGYAGSYSGNLTVSATPTPVATRQRFTVEVYRTNNLGTPIASGVSGAPVGDLGVTVVAILDSGELNINAGAITNVAVNGILTQNITINTGERLRYHVSAAKIGAGGGNVTFGVYYGSSYNSYYDVPVAITTDAVVNKSTVVGVTDTDALNTLKTADQAVAGAGIPFGHITDAAQTIAGAKTYTSSITSTGFIGSTNLNLSSTSTGDIRFSTNSIEKGRFFGSTGNFLIQNGGTFTDASYRLDVSGITRLNGDTNINGFIKGTVNKVLPSGISFAGQTFNLTGTDATSNLITETRRNYNEDGFASSDGTSFIYSTYVNKSTNQPSTNITNFNSFAIQTGSGTLNSLYAMRATLGASGGGTGAITTAAFFGASNGPINLIYPITNFYGLDLAYMPTSTVGTVTNSRGIFIGDVFASTIARGIDLNVSSGTGKHNIYSAGSAPNYFAGNVLIGTPTSNGNAFRLTGTAELITTPTTSAGTYDILTRNTSTGVVEKVASTAYATTASPTFTGTPTAPTATAGTNTTQVATTAFVQAAIGTPYLKYVALVSQSGTSAPTATVLENTLGGTVVWARTSAGFYTGTLTGAFTANKTACIISSTSTAWINMLSRSDVNSVLLQTSSQSTNTMSDAMLFDTFVEIRVYN